MPVDISNIVKGYLFIIILGLTRQIDSTMFVYCNAQKVYSSQNEYFNKIMSKTDKTIRFYY